MIVEAVRSPFDAGKHAVLLKKLPFVVGVDDLAGLVQRGLISLFEVYADDKLLGIILGKVDRLWDGSFELAVLLGAAVDKPPIPFTRHLRPLLDQLAHDQGCKSIRIHSDQRGVSWIIEKNNYRFLETVYRKVL